MKVCLRIDFLTYIKRNYIGITTNSGSNMKSTLTQAELQGQIIYCFQHFFFVETSATNGHSINGVIKAKVRNSSTGLTSRLFYETTLKNLGYLLIVSRVNKEETPNTN